VPNSEVGRKEKPPEGGSQFKPDDRGSSEAKCWLWLPPIPLAQGLSIEVAAHSVVGRFVTTRERFKIPRPYVQLAQCYVEPQRLTRINICE
jgi:hypothetical protein